MYEMYRFSQRALVCFAFRYWLSLAFVSIAVRGIHLFMERAPEAEADRLVAPVPEYAASR
jgi:hypothetical protein